VITRIAIIVGFFASASSALAEQPPVIPVGLDAYRMWDRWAQQRIGARAYMRSTYDRTGGNRGPDASHFLYQLADDQNVTLDVAGAGVLYFARYNHWHGSPWHYVADGGDHVISETSTADPNKPAENSTFLPREALPNPLTWTWSDTRGADLMWVPIGFEHWFRMGYERTRYGTGYYIYHQFVPGAPLSQPIRAWDAKTPPGKKVLDLLRAAGSDIAPAGTSTNGSLTIPQGRRTAHRAPTGARCARGDDPRADVLRAEGIRDRAGQRAAAHHVGRPQGTFG
jgi:hypothetical protein